MLKYIFSGLVLCCLVATTQAQEFRASDSTKNKFLPTGIRVATDLLSLIRSKTSDKFSGWEVNADVDLGRYYVTYDYGVWGMQHTLKNGYYDNYGKYYRVGVDVNFLLRDPDRNMFFLGARYGTAHFTDSVSVQYTDSNFGDVLHQFANPGVDAHWVELTGGLRVKIWKWIWMGYTARFKFGLSTKGDVSLKSYDVPGYGLSSFPNYWGFNYQVFLRLPIRKQR